MDITPNYGEGKMMASNKSIYDLGAYNPATNIREPFYVGRTERDITIRHKEHKAGGKKITARSVLKDKYIRDLTAADIKWDIQVQSTCTGSMADQTEDQLIMDHLRAGYKLKNMKKGDENWLARRVVQAADMNKRKITDYVTYKKVLSDEEQQAKVDAAQARWLAAEDARIARETAEAALAQLKATVDKIIADNIASGIIARQAKQAIADKIVAEAAARGIIAQQAAITAKVLARVKAVRLAAAMEVDKIAREVRLKAETAAMVAADLARTQAEIIRKKDEYKIAKDAKTAAMVAWGKEVSVRVAAAACRRAAASWLR